MRHLINKLLLFLYTLLTLLFVPISSAFVMSTLLSVISTCCMYFMDKRLYKTMISLAYAALSFFLPEMILFFPLICCDLFQFRLYPALALNAVSFFASIGSLPGKHFLFTAAGILIAFFIQSLTEAYDRLLNQYRRTRDDSTELNLLLREKNKNLLERQDYEIYTATLRERNRIAREIHDNVGHMLTRSILMIGALKTTQHDTPLQEPLSLLENTLTTAMDSIRSSVHNLHDESVNLTESARALIKDFTFCPVSLKCEVGTEVPRDIKYSFISILKEALANMMKHSLATEGSVSIEELPGFYRMIIKDNGKAKEPVSYNGIGLLNMKERIDAFDGHIRFSAENGFCIFITVPKKNKESENVS